MRVRIILLISIVLNAVLLAALLFWFNPGQKRASTLMRQASAAPANTNSFRILKTNILVRPRLMAWSEVESPQGEFQVRKHTVTVQPAQRVSYLVTADALRRWAYHCHLLYHMEAGMFREVQVTE